MSSPSSRRVDEAYALATRVFSVIIIGFGTAILVVTIVNGGEVTSFGILIGILFVAMGIGRLYLALRGPR